MIFYILQQIVYSKCRTNKKLCFGTKCPLPYCIGYKWFSDCEPLQNAVGKWGDSFQLKGNGSIVFSRLISYINIWWQRANFVKITQDTGGLPKFLLSPQ